MKKIVIIGTSSDVIAKKRGKFFDKYFDDILICNKSIFHLKTHKDYLGTPTIWGNCGWSNKDRDEVFDPDENKCDNIYAILDEHKIKKVWLNHSMSNLKLSYNIPENIEVTSICSDKYEGFTYHSLGLQSIVYSLLQNYRVYYCGIDSYRKSHHYYKEKMPANVFSLLHTQSNYIKENKIIKSLIAEGKLTHVDTIIDEKVY